MLKYLILTFGLFVMDGHSIGLQHAVFRSQSTQGPTWLGTAEIQKEAFDITVYPDYLDVQLDWEFGIGGSKPAAYENALEIVGNINLEANSTVVGMLLWNGDKILKAKLKTKDQARKEYESVVDRNSDVPPPPRDPVILEWIRQDNYDLSIFPIAWGGVRKLRLRYLVPAANGSVGYPHAFTANAKVTLRRGAGVAGFDLTTSASAGKTSFTAPAVTLNPSEFGFMAYGYSGKPTPGRVFPVLQDSSKSSRLYIGSFFGNGFAGQAAHVVYHLPQGLLDGQAASPESPTRIYATLHGDKDSCRKQISPLENGSGIQEELKILTRETFEEDIHWSVFAGDVLKKEVVEPALVIRMEDGVQFARSFGNSRVFPMAETMPFSLGSALGFIDTKYALVALEEDVLTAITADKYVLTGVPTLNPEDIFPSKEDTAIAASTWMANRGYDANQLLKANTTSINPLTGLPEGIRFDLRNGRIYIRLDQTKLNREQHVKVAIFSLMGRFAKQWNPSELSRGEMSWSPSESGLAGGTFVLKIEIGARKYSRSFSLR